MQETMRTMTATLTSGPRASIQRWKVRAEGALARAELMAMPADRGMRTIWSMDLKRAMASTGSHAPASQRVRKGVAMMAVVVEVRVSSTLSGTLARAR
jgi:hypothetical protein